MSEKFKWVKVTLNETFRVPEGFDNNDCMSYMIETLYENGGWPAVDVELLPNQAEQEEAYEQRKKEFKESQDKLKHWNIYEKDFTYSCNETDTKLNDLIDTKCSIAELLEHGFVNGDHIVFGIIHSIDTKLLIVGKEAECTSHKLISKLKELFKDGLISDVMEIETVLMELYKTLVINYIN